jgi:DNA polymerase I-like protein with 3'-5' exonuclease and polymerase domains
MELTQQYQQRSEQLIQEIRDWARWPEFNPKSPYQMRELLFGAKYNRKKLSKKELEELPEGVEPPEYVSVRPRGAKTMNLKPLFTTDKYPIAWDRVEQEHRDHLATTSTNKNTVAQLAFFHPQRTITTADGKERTLNFKPILDKLRHWNVVSQTLRYVLRPPQRNEEEMEPVYDDEGNLIYDSGIPSSICDDGRVRTHIYPTKATGRWSSARPSLQNLGKRVEGVLKEIFQEDYKHPLRSIFQAPEGHVFVEADYVGVEVAIAAFMSNDPAMLEHVHRNQLPEDHPDHYDMHSHVAVSAFHLECPPTKKGLASLGREYLRIIAKAVLFGLFYGRSPRAIAAGAKSEGILVTEFEAAAIIEQIDHAYPRLLPYFERCDLRANNPRWLANSFGRYRRFPAWLDGEQLKRFGRQAKNFPIQGTVADAMNRAADCLYIRRNKMKLKTRIALQIHDAIILQVPDDEVKVVYEELLPMAMVKSVPITPADLNGNPLPGIPERWLGIDIEIFREWGRPIRDLSVFGINKH